jgi:hypothetical protein
MAVLEGISFLCEDYLFVTKRSFHDFMYLLYVHE